MATSTIQDGSVGWKIVDTRKGSSSSSSGSSSTGSGEDNKINSISIDGTTITPDSSKNVNIDLSDYAKKSDLDDYVTVDQLVDNIPNASSTTNGLMSKEDKDRLDGLINTGGEANKIENVAVNGTDLVINNKRVNIDLSTYTTSIKDNIGNASSTSNGLMSAADKSKLDNLSTSSSSGTSSGEDNKIESISVDGVKQTIDSNKNVNITLNTKYATKDELDDYVKSSELSSITGGDINKIENVAVNGTDLIITDKRVNIDLNEYAKKTDLTNSINNIPKASSTTNGLMSKEDKDRLDGLIETGGEANKIDSISVDGVTQNIDNNKNVNIVLSDYAKKTDVTASINDIPNASSTTNGLMSKEDKDRLDGLINTGGEANKINSISIDGTTITPDSSKNININLSDYTTSIKDNIGNVSSTSNGLMSAEDKSKLDSLSTSSSSGTSSGEDNKIENVAVNGTDLEITDKRVNIDLSKYTTSIKDNIGNASSTSNGLMSKEDKDRLDGLINTGGEANKIENVAVNGTDLVINNKRVNIDLSEYARTDQLVDNIPNASSTTNGLMSKEDKDRLDGLIETGGEANKIDSISVDGVTQNIDNNKNVNIVLSDYAKKTDVTASINNISNASTSSNGLMSKEDKDRLDNLVTTGGEANKIDSISIDGNVIEPDSSKNVNIDLSNYTTSIKDNIGNASTSSNGLMSSSDKSKLDGIASNAEVNTINNVAVNGTDLIINDKKVNIPLASTSTLGVVKIGTNININNGTISVPTFGTSTAGIVPQSDGSDQKFLRADGQWIEIKREPNETPVLLISKNDVELNGDNLVETISITTNSDGEISVLNSNNTVCTMSYDNTTKNITITAVQNGSSNIVISLSSTDVYKSATSTINITISDVCSPILSENTPLILQKFALNGTASSLWSVGDIYPIKLNGTLGPNTLENVEIGLQIIGFNHNADIEGNNTIHFQCGVKDGKPIAFYWANTPSSQHHTTNTNSGGWEQSDLRTRCNEFYNCLPQEWKDVIKTTTKYTNNVGQSNSEDAVTATQDKIFLLAGNEINNKHMDANQYEQNKQQQYEYYINGTPYSNWNIRQRALFEIPIMNINDGTGWWWLRSPYYAFDTASSFTVVNNLGYLGKDNSSKIKGFSPAFAIG